MEKNYKRGNSNSENNSRENNQRYKNTYGKRNFKDKRENYNHKTPNRNHESENDYESKSYRQNNRKPYDKNSVNNRQYNDKRQYNKNRSNYDNRESYDNKYNDKNNRKNYKKDSESFEGRPNYRNGNTYIDEKGFRHRKYWSHEDRKRKAIEKEAEIEDDAINTDGTIRLNKFLSNSGMCSRREADNIISKGLVTVNGKTVTEMGVKVSITDEVRYNGQLLHPEPKRYILLNKPKDYITTLRDPHARDTVMELIAGACKERVYPVGRLDRNTTGVLLFTNDGELAKKLTHPSNEVQKIYHVTTDKNVTKKDLEQIAQGIELEDGFISADEIAYLDDTQKCEIGIRIHSGRNRIVRRIFEYFGYEVKKLDRVMFAGLDKKGLSRGKWRFLTDNEIGYLQMISNKKATEKPHRNIRGYED